jgi:hypothetical protein
VFACSETQVEVEFLVSHVGRGYFVDGTASVSNLKLSCDCCQAQIDFPVSARFSVWLNEHACGAGEGMDAVEMAFPPEAQASPPGPSPLSSALETPHSATLLKGRVHGSISAQWHQLGAQVTSEHHKRI